MLVHRASLQTPKISDRLTPYRSPIMLLAQRAKSRGLGQGPRSFRSTLKPDELELRPSFRRAGTLVLRRAKSPPMGAGTPGGREGQVFIFGLLGPLSVFWPSLPVGCHAHVRVGMSSPPQEHAYASVSMAPRRLRGHDPLERGNYDPRGHGRARDSRGTNLKDLKNLKLVCLRLLRFLRSLVLLGRAAPSRRGTTHQLLHLRGDWDRARPCGCHSRESGNPSSRDTSHPTAPGFLPAQE